MMGPNVHRLVGHKMAVLLASEEGGVAGALEAVRDRARLTGVGREAARWVVKALADVRSAPDCPFPDDEAVAGAILRCVDAELEDLREGVLP